MHLGRFKRRLEMIEMTSDYTTRHTTAELLEEAAPCASRAARSATARPSPASTNFVERKVFVESPTGRFVQPRIPYRISGVEPRPFQPAPQLGEHDGTIDWSPSGQSRGPDRDATPGPSLPLDGVRIIDCTAWWAGPAATHALACLGADVIKVESVSRPDLMRYTSTRRPPDPQWFEWGPLFHGATTANGP